MMSGRMTMIAGILMMAFGIGLMLIGFDHL